MEYAIRIPMAAPQEYVNTYSTRRVTVPCRGKVPYYTKLCHLSSKRLEDGIVGFCPLQNIGSWRGTHPNTAGLTTCGNREANPGSRCFVEESAVLYQLCHFPWKRLEGKWHNWYSTARSLYIPFTDSL